MDNTDIRHGQIRKTKIIDRELSRLNVDIAALQETRLSGCGSLKETNYTFFWQGLTQDMPRHHGVGFAVRNRLLSATSTPVGVSERLMTMRIHVSGGYVSLVSAYAPTLQASSETKDAFYESLSDTINTVPSCEQLYLLGDFNARVGKNHDAWPNALGHFGVGNMNENGERLLDFCSANNLAITNTYFNVNFKRCVSWRHPRSGHWHQIDFILARKKFLNSCKLTRAFHSADCNTDHALIVCKVKIQVKRPPRSATHPQKKINIRMTRNPVAIANFNESFTHKTHTLLSENLSIDESWRELSEIIYDCAAGSYGTSRSSRKDWVESNADILIPLIEEKRAALVADKRASSDATRRELRRAKGEVQRVSRQCANAYWQNLCEEMQAASDQGNMKDYYSLLKVALGPNIVKASALRSKEGHPIIDRSLQMDRWVEHYSELYSREDLVRPKDELGQLLPAFPEMIELDVPPTQDELNNAVAHLSNGKSPGMDGIPSEVLKSGNQVMLPPLHRLLSRCWEEGSVPQNMKNALVTTLYKNKGEKGSCDNYRGISLLSTTGKAFARVLLGRLHTLAERILPESQCGFRAQRSTIDMIFTLKQLQEKCREQRRPLYIAFVDMAKAFDTVCRPALYMVLQSIGCPPKLLKLVSSFHDGMCSSIQYEGSRSREFLVGNGVKQGCVLAPTLFGIYFSVLLRVAFGDEDNDGIYIRTRFDGSLFNLARFRSRRRTTEGVCRDLLFADDAALVAHDEQSLQTMLDRLDWACRVFSLNISVTKTKILPQGVQTAPIISLGEENLATVNRFTYLGSVVTHNLSLDEELAVRIGKAATSFGRLTGRVWGNSKLTLKTKIQVYQTCVLSTLLYGSETWTVYSKQEKRLNTFHMRNLRKILHITWRDKISNMEVLRRSGVLSINELLRRNRLRWLGHVQRMEDDRLPKQVLYSELSEGTRAVGRPKLRYKDLCKTTLRELNIDIDNWEGIAEDRGLWRSTIRDGLASYRGNMEQREQLKRERRRQARERVADINDGFICAVCQRICGSRIGLFSHERSCRGAAR